MIFSNQFTEVTLFTSRMAERGLEPAFRALGLGQERFLSKEDAMKWINGILGKPKEQRILQEDYYKDLTNLQQKLSQQEETLEKHRSELNALYDEYQRVFMQLVFPMPSLQLERRDPIVNDIANKVNKLTILREAKKELEEELDRKYALLNEENAHLKEMMKDKDKIIKDLREEVDKLRKDKQELERKIFNLEIELEQLRRTSEELKNAVEEKDKKLCSLGKKVDENDEKMMRIISQKQNEITRVIKENEQLEKHNDELSRNVDYLKDTVESLVKQRERTK